MQVCSSSSVRRSKPGPRDARRTRPQRRHGAAGTAVALLGAVAHALAADECATLASPHISYAECIGPNSAPLVDVTHCFEFVNRGPQAISQVEFMSFNARKAYLWETFVFDPPLAVGSAAPLCIQIYGATPTDEFCFYVLAQGVDDPCCCGTAGCVIVPRCPIALGDLTYDGFVDGADLGRLLAAWGACVGCAEDLDQDGAVDGADLGLLLAAWTPG